MNKFCLTRWWGIVIKEFLQLKRDRLTFAMIIGIPIMQLTIFGFAINVDPRNLPTAVLIADDSPFVRSFLASMKATGYFDIKYRLNTEAEAMRVLAEGKVLFVVNIPVNFSRDLLRFKRPSILVQVDATDPVATGNAVSALNELTNYVSNKDFIGPLAKLKNEKPAFDVKIHRLYNPGIITQYNIVPGLLGVILVMTMVMMTSLAITRERERGTMENLLSTPVKPIEVMTGKIVPYILIGFVQTTIVLLATYFVFNVPFRGSVLVVYFVTLLFIIANLMIGITFSSLARNQLQAVQLSFFYFLPNVLLSGFMFPFAGMPVWAQILGNLLPMTYFNRLIRELLLKGNSWLQIWPNFWPLLIIIIVATFISLRLYRNTLD